MYNESCIGTYPSRLEGRSFSGIKPLAFKVGAGLSSLLMLSAGAGMPNNGGGSVAISADYNSPHGGMYFDSLASGENVEVDFESEAALGHGGGHASIDYEAEASGDQYYVPSANTHKEPHEHKEDSYKPPHDKQVYEEPIHYHPSLIEQKLEDIESQHAEDAKDYYDQAETHFKLSEKEKKPDKRANYLAESYAYYLMALETYESGQGELTEKQYSRAQWHVEEMPIEIYKLQCGTGIDILYPSDLNALLGSFTFYPNGDIVWDDNPEEEILL